MTPGEMVSELLRLSSLLDQANTAVRDRGRAMADAERDYRKGKAQCWLTVDPDGTAQQRKDEVDGMTANLRRARDLAEHDRQAALEAVRNFRTQISALQSIAGVEREMVAFDRTGPQVSP